MIIKDLLFRLLRNNSGATAIEYGLIVSLIVIAMIVSLNQVADTTINMWHNVSATAEASMGHM